MWNAVKWVGRVEICSNKSTKSSKPLKVTFSRRCGRACPLPIEALAFPPRMLAISSLLHKKCFHSNAFDAVANPTTGLIIFVCGWCCKSVTIASWRPESFHTLTTIHRSQNPRGDRAKKHSERERLPLQCCTYQCHVYLQYSRGLGPRSTPLCWLFQYTLQKTQTEAPTQNYLNPSVSR